MMLRPLGRRVLISPVYEASVTPSGLILPRHSSISPEGIVLHESGNPLYANQGVVVAVPRPNGQAFDVALDDFVIFSPFAGDIVKIGGESFVAIDEREILAAVEEPSTSERTSHHGRRPRSGRRSSRRSRRHPRRR